MNLFTYFVISFILVNPILNCFLFTFGLHSESGQLQIAYILMFTFTLLYVFYDYMTNIYSAYKIIYPLILIVLITFLFLLTRFFYNIENAMYNSEFLCWGASSLPATLCGAMYTWRSTNDIHKKLPYFIVPLTIIISYVSYTTGGRTSGNRILDETTGMNYQSISYYMAQLFGLTVFCILVGYEKKKIMINSILYMLLVAQFVTCFFSGGRGGLLLLILYFLFFLYKKIRLQKINLYSIIYAVIFVLFFIVVISQFDILETVGFSRLIDTVYQGDSNRANLQLMALKVFESSPLFGHGIGSVFFEIGTYSHNFLIDIMVELGLIGLVVMVYVLFVCVSFLKKYNNNYDVLFISIIFIYSLTLNSFSGYWLANHLLWFVLGYILTVYKRIC